MEKIVYCLEEGSYNLAARDIFDDSVEYCTQKEWEEIKRMSPANMKLLGMLSLKMHLDIKAEVKYSSLALVKRGRRQQLTIPEKFYPGVVIHTKGGVCYSMEEGKEYTLECSIECPDPDFFEQEASYSLTAFKGTAHPTIEFIIPVDLELVDMNKNSDIYNQN